MRKAHNPNLSRPGPPFLHLIHNTAYPVSVSTTGQHEQGLALYPVRPGAIVAKTALPD